jgi:hypothetical protein
LAYGNVLAELEEGRADAAIAATMKGKAFEAVN